MIRRRNSDSVNAAHIGNLLKVGMRLFAISFLALGVANCSSGSRSTAKVDPKYGVKPSPRVVRSGKPVPKGGGRAMIGKPYVVAGKKYVPHEKENYVAVGTASWYGADFHGRKTANGEIFDKHSIAAAHPTLPLPSYVRVTNLGNNRSMVVRVNDRGPFHGNRLIDLSRGAAEALDFQRQGTARVKVEYIGRASLKGSDDRKLLATLTNQGPAVVPFGTPAVSSPVMVASAAPAVNAPAAAHASSGLVADATSAAPAAQAEGNILSAELLSNAVEVASTDTLPQSTDTSNLTGLVQEVAFNDMPMPPPRPLELVATRTILPPAVLSGIPSISPPVRRSVVAALPYAQQSDSLGIFFEPMPINALTPQRFVSFNDPNRSQVR